MTIIQRDTQLTTPLPLLRWWLAGGAAFFCGPVWHRELSSEYLFNVMIVDSFEKSDIERAPLPFFHILYRARVYRPVFLLFPPPPPQVEMVISTARIVSDMFVVDYPPGSGRTTRG